MISLIRKKVSRRLMFEIRHLYDHSEFTLINIWKKKSLFSI